MKKHIVVSLFLSLSILAVVEGKKTIPSLLDLNAIYNDRFQYSLPKQFLESLLSGDSFDYKTCYTAQEKDALARDIQDIYNRIIASQPARGSEIIISAGSPGSGKSRLFEQLRAQESQNMPLVDPDGYWNEMQGTYKADIARGMSPEEAYRKWRPASNAAAHLIFAHLIRDGRAFYFGTTSSGPQTSVLFNWLKERGYTIRLIHVSAPDQVRWSSVEKHNVLHTTREDVYQKGKLVPQRIVDTYLKFADQIAFYYRSGVDENAQLAARWTKGQPVQVIDSNAYAGVKSVHNAVIRELDNMDILLWENAVETVEAEAKR